MTKPTPLMMILLNAWIEKHGPLITIPLPYTTAGQAEHVQRLMMETCPGLDIELEICGGDWRLVVSKKASPNARVNYDN